MAKQTWLNVSGTWKKITNIWEKVSGVWKEKVISWYKVAGVWKQVQEYPSISASGSLHVDNIGNDSDSCSIDVTPDTMDTTSTKVDTGDGTAWFKISLGATATGDFTLEVTLLSYPSTDVSAIVRVTDNDDSSIFADVNVYYTYAA